MHRSKCAINSSGWMPMPGITGSRSCYHSHCVWLSCFNIRRHYINACTKAFCQWPSARHSDFRPSPSVSFSAPSCSRRHSPNTHLLNLFPRHAKHLEDVHGLNAYAAHTAHAGQGNSSRSCSLQIAVPALVAVPLRQDSVWNPKLAADAGPQHSNFHLPTFAL